MTPNITYKQGASNWGIDIFENGVQQTIDFSKLTKGGRAKARRMLVEALKKMGYFKHA